jgi:hypothetical protein
MLETYISPLGRTATARAPTIVFAGMMEVTKPLRVATVRMPPKVWSARAHQPPLGAQAMPGVTPWPARTPMPSITHETPRPDTVETVLGAPGTMRRSKKLAWSNT